MTTRAKDFNHLGKWLPVQIEKAGIPMFKVAHRAGISRASIYSWMADKTRPDSETLLRFVQALAALTGQDSAQLHAEALRQYVNKPEGRRPGADWAGDTTGVRARKRKR